MSRHRLHLLLPLLAAVPVVLASCVGDGSENGGWHPPRVVKVKGAKEWVVMSPLYGTRFLGDEAGQETAVLLRDGELLGVADETAIPYRAADGAALSLAGEKPRVILNGKTAGLVLDDEDGWQWLDSAGPDDLALVRYVDVRGNVDDRKLALLKKLAAASPGVGLGLGDDETLRQVLPLLDPPWLSLGNPGLAKEDVALLTSRTALHTLTINAGKISDLAFLGQMKALRTLFLSDYEAEKHGPFPAEAQHLRSVIVFGGETRDLLPFAKLAGLEELSLNLCKSLADISALEKLPNLRTLRLCGCPSVTDLTPLKHLKHLKWLHLPEKTSQQQLVEVIRDHPDLAVLELGGCENVTDLSPIRDLKGLQSLVLVGLAAKPEPLFEMKGLKFLGVHLAAKDGEDAKKRAEAETAVLMPKLRQALPDTAVVRVAPICLGSGWILLLVPAGAAAWGLARRRARRVGAGR